MAAAAQKFDDGLPPATKMSDPLGGGGAEQELQGPRLVARETEASQIVTLEEDRPCPERALQARRAHHRGGQEGQSGPGTVQLHESGSVVRASRARATTSSTIRPASPTSHVVHASRSCSVATPSAISASST